MKMECDDCGETVEAHEVPQKHGFFRITKDGKMETEDCKGKFKKVRE